MLIFLHFLLQNSPTWWINHYLQYKWLSQSPVHFLFSGQHSIKVKFCEHEPEAATLVRNGFWPSSPKQPQVAFDQGLMMLLHYLFLECRVSLKNIYQALQWMAPSLSKVYVSSVFYLSCLCSFIRQPMTFHHHS